MHNLCVLLTPATPVYAYSCSLPTFPRGSQECCSLNAAQRHGWFKFKGGVEGGRGWGGSVTWQSECPLTLAIRIGVFDAAMVFSAVRLAGDTPPKHDLSQGERPIAVAGPTVRVRCRTVVSNCLLGQLCRHRHSLLAIRCRSAFATGLPLLWWRGWQRFGTPLLYLSLDFGTGLTGMEG